MSIIPSAISQLYNSPTKQKKARKKQTIPPAHRLVVRCTVDNDISFASVFLPGYPLSAARCRVDCQTLNAGVVTLGESLRLVAAGGLINPEQYE